MTPTPEESWYYSILRVMRDAANQPNIRKEDPGTLQGLREWIHIAEPRKNTNKQSPQPFPSKAPQKK